MIDFFEWLLLGALILLLISCTCIFGGVFGGDE